MKSPLYKADKYVRVLGVVLGLYTLAFAFYIRFFGMFILGLALALGFASTFLPRIYLPKSVLGLGLVSFSMLLAMVFGMDETRMQLNSKKNLLTANVQLTDKSLKAIVLRSGERGLLIYDTRSQTFSFNRWEAVKAVDWSRKGLKASLEDATTEFLRAD
jgi:hypothetical protein